MESLVGTILIAPPMESSVSRVDSVILVTNEYNQYHIGLRLNSRSHMTVSELAAYSGHRVDMTNTRVYAGGNHSLNSFSMLHSPEWICDNTIRINDFVSISSSNEVMRRFAAGDKPKHWRMFLGITKWAPGQLEAEINGTPPFNHDLSWCYIKSTPGLVFATDHNEMWDIAMSAAVESFTAGIF